MDSLRAAEDRFNALWEAGLGDVLAHSDERARAWTCFLLGVAAGSNLSLLAMLAAEAAGGN